MSGVSSSAGAWCTQLEPVRPPHPFARHPDDPRLGEIIELWRGDAAALWPGRAVLVGFPQDEGVRRNHGRPGAAEAPDAIRRCLYRLTPWDSETGADLAHQPPLDAGNLRTAGPLEATQEALGEVIAALLHRGTIPVVLGGSHETAYGHYLGYARQRRRVGIINLDAHLDLRPWPDNQGHSGSPFRQALEHPAQPLPGSQYVCLGAQPHAVSQAHWCFAREHGCVVRWGGEVGAGLAGLFRNEVNRLAAAGCSVYVSIDADVVRAADVPGVSAPNPAGLPGETVAACARLAGSLPAVSSLDLVEINPRHDRDDQSARWAALVVWNFLIGVASRNGPRRNADLADQRG